MRGILADHVTIYQSPRIAAPGAGWLFYTFCFLAILTVLPPYIAPEWRAWVLGAMPLVSIAVSMTLGVWALRVISAVALTQLGFALSVAALVWLLVAPGLPVACLALAGALGLVQGASFAAIPQLNTTAATQAQAYGAMAQTGNLGNTVGTPRAARDHGCYGLCRVDLDQHHRAVRWIFGACVDGRAARPLTSDGSKAHVHGVFSFFHWRRSDAGLCTTS